MFKVNSAARVIAASVIATAFAATSFADMVYDDERSMSPAPTSPTSVEVKNVISNNAEVSSTQPVIVSSSETVQVQKVSERSREKRGFQESVNNELVIQKLEDRRLKQEEKLTAEINKKFTLEDDAGTAAPVMKEEVVVKPIASANASYEMSAAPKGNAAAANAIVTDEVNLYQSSTNMSVAPVSGKPEGEKAFKSGVAITPKAGLSTISNDFYDFRNQYVLGVALGFDVSDYVSIDLGYTFSDFQVGPKNEVNFAPYGYNFNRQSFKNNTFDFGMKLFLTSRDSKVRPYVGGGMAYSLGYVNYDQSTLGNYMSTYGRWSTDDYQLNQFQGMLQAGIDFKVASNVTIGAGYKYLKPLSTTESQPLYNGSFYTPYAPNQYLDPNLLAVSRSLRDSNVQMFLVNASVLF